MQTSDTTWQAYNDYGGNSLYKCTVGVPARRARRATRPPTRSPTTGRCSTEGPSHAVQRRRVPDDPLPRGQRLRRHLHQRRRRAPPARHAAQPQALHLQRPRRVLVRHAADRDGERARRRREPRVLHAATRASGRPAGSRARPAPRPPTARSSPTRTRTSPSARTRSSGPARGATRACRPRAENVTPENALTGPVVRRELRHEPHHGALRLPPAADVAQHRGRRRSPPNTSLALAPDTLGYEWDEDPDNGFRPAGSFRLSSTTVSNVEVFTDYGSTTRPDGTATHNMTMYRAPSGARVFGAGTVQWALGPRRLEPGGQPVDRNMRQATVNLFADMGAQPATPPERPRARRPRRRTRRGRPRRHARRPRSAADGTRITLTGTASDAGGGVVAGVEVSTDNGATWHLATGTTAGRTRGSSTARRRRPSRCAPPTTAATPRSRAPAARSPSRCPCSLWGNARHARRRPTPATRRRSRWASSSVRHVRDDHAASASTSRAANTGTHSGSLWTAERPAPRPGDVQRRVGHRLAVGHVRRARHGPAEHDLRRLVLRAQRALRRHVRVLLPRPVARPERRGDRRRAAAARRPQHRHDRQRPLRLRLVERLPDRLVQGEQLLGRRDVRADAGARPGDRRDRDRGRQHDPRTCRGPRPRPAARRRATRSRRTSAPRRRRRRSSTAPATSTTMTGLTTGTTYRFTVQATNPNGDGAGLGAVERRSPRRRRSPPPRPTAVKAQPGTVVGPRDVDRLRGRRRQPDHGPDRDAVHRRDRADARPGRRGRDERDGDRPDERHELHVPRDAPTNAVGTSPASAASNAVTPQSTIFDFTTPVGNDLRRPHAGRAGRQVHRRLHRHDHRRPLLQGGRERRDARRQPVERRRPAARPGDVHQRDGLRLAGGDVRRRRSR